MMRRDYQAESRRERLAALEARRKANRRSARVGVVKTLGGGLAAVLLVIAINLALLAGAVAVVVLVLQALGVL